MGGGWSRCPDSSNTQQQQKSQLATIVLYVPSDYRFVAAVWVMVDGGGGHATCYTLWSSLLSLAASPQKKSREGSFSIVTCVSPFLGFRCSSERHHGTRIMLPVGRLLLVAAAAVFGSISKKKCYQSTVTPSLGNRYVTEILICVKAFFITSACFRLPPAGIFSYSRFRGTLGARRNTTAQVWTWPTSVARALEIHNCMFPRGGIPSTWGRPGPCKPTYRFKECPTPHVISGILNINVVRHDLVMEKAFPNTNS